MCKPLLICPEIRQGKLRSFVSKVPNGQVYPRNAAGFSVKNLNYSL